MAAEDFSAVTEGFYEAATVPARLSRIGELLWEFMQVDSGIMYVCEQSTGRMLHLVSATENFDESARVDYAAHYHGINPWFGRALLKTPPYTARGEELIDPTAFDRTEFAGDWCRRVGIYHMIGSTRPIADGIVVGAGIHRSRRDGAFSDGEAAIYDKVTAHAARALQIAWRVGAAERNMLACEEAAYAAGAGVLLLDARRRLLFANRVGERLLSTQDWFKVRNGRLEPGHLNARKPFEDAVATASAIGTLTAGGVPGGVVSLSDRQGRRLNLLVAPYRSGEVADLQPQAEVLVQFTDPGLDNRPAAEALRDAFGLTPAEARLAIALAQGVRLADHAESVGISLNTVKTLLSRVFRKTETARQAELVRLLLSDQSLRRADPYF